MFVINRVCVCLCLCVHVSMWMWKCGKATKMSCVRIVLVSPCSTGQRWSFSRCRNSTARIRYSNASVHSNIRSVNGQSKNDRMTSEPIFWIRFHHDPGLRVIVKTNTRRDLKACHAKMMEANESISSNWFGYNVNCGKCGESRWVGNLINLS